MQYQTAGKPFFTLLWVKGFDFVYCVNFMKLYEMNRKTLFFSIFTL